MHPNITDFPNKVLRTERLRTEQKKSSLSYGQEKKKRVFQGQKKCFVEVILFLLLLKNVMHMNDTLFHYCRAKSNLFRKNNTSFILSKTW